MQLALITAGLVGAGVTVRMAAVLAQTPSSQGRQAFVRSALSGPRPDMVVDEFPLPEGVKPELKN